MEKIVHEIAITGYKADAGGTLNLGTWGSFGNEQLHLTTDEAWDGAVITANFNVNDEVVAQAIADRNGYLNVPWEALKENTYSGKIVFVGDWEQNRRITADARFKVTNHSNYLVDDGPVPGDDKWNQFVNQNKEYRDQAIAAAEKAEQSEANAKTSEENAGTYADNAKASEDKAAEYAKAAKQSENNAATSAQGASDSEDAASKSAQAAAASASAASSSAIAAKTSEQNANASELSASQSASNASTFSGQASNSAGQARDSASTANSAAERAAASAASAAASNGAASASAGAASDSASEADASKAAAAASAAAAKESAELAQQIAVKNGYMQMRVDPDTGHLIYKRTDSIKDTINFAIVDDTNLEVYING